jgi:hypothetical protein
MSYTWYKLINVSEFSALGLVSRELTLELDGIGERTILITKGAQVGVLYEGIFLVPDLIDDANPFEFEGHAAYIDASDDLWLGIEVEE